MEDSKSVVLDFGYSAWASSRPTLDENSRMTISIPTHGELAPIPSQTNYLPKEVAPATKFFAASEQSGQTFLYDAIQFPLSSTADRTETVIMPWISHRREWVVLHHSSWLETCHKDESYAGPYALDNYCAQKLMEAYSLQKTLDVATVAKTSPADLEALVKK